VYCIIKDTAIDKVLGFVRNMGRITQLYFQQVFVDFQQVPVKNLKKKEQEIIWWITLSLQDCSVGDLKIKLFDVGNIQNIITQGGIK
jgi:hypothetical protein